MLRYGVKIREENLGTGILYIPDLLYKMIRAGKAGEFSPCERMFICQLTVEAGRGQVSKLMTVMAKKLNTKFSGCDQG